eukprot:1060726-Amphidinium_carterae.1
MLAGCTPRKSRPFVGTLPPTLMGHAHLFEDNLAIAASGVADVEVEFDVDVSCYSSYPLLQILGQT